MAGNPIGNLLGKVDSNGALLVAISGAAGPVDSLAFSGGSSINGVTTNTLKLRATGTTDILTLTTSAVTSTVPYLAPNGLISAPSLSFSSEPTSGWYWASAGDIKLSVLNNNYIRATASTVYIQNGLLNLGGDVDLSRGAADRLDLATGDSFRIVSGGLGVGTTNVAAGTVSASGAVTGLGGITSAGLTGVPVVVAVGRVTAQSAANASISTFTVGASDGSFEVSANMNVTASTTLITTLTCTYTDESNTARTMILPVTPLSGSFIAAGAITGAGASVWETPVMHIRCKAATAITILTSVGTFSGVTYTAEGVIKQTK